MTPETSGSIAILVLGLLVLYLGGHPDGRKLLDRARRTARMRRLARVQGGPILPLDVALVPYLWPGGRCRRIAAGFRALGFQEIGRYRMKPTTKRGIVLTHDDGRIVAEVWEGSWKGLSVNVYALAQSGEVMELSGTPDPRHPTPPWHRIVDMGGTRNMRKQMERFEAATPWEDPLLVTRENYREIKVAKRRRVVEWLLANGRIRAHMVPGLERRTGMRADPAALEFLRRERP